MNIRVIRGRGFVLTMGCGVVGGMFFCACRVNVKATKAEDDLPD